MASVDNRVVSIQFDNAAFEQKVASTIANLDKLKTSLDFANAKNGFANLNTSAQSLNMNPITSAIDGISTKFLALSTIGITVLSNIANKAFETGMSITKSFSFGPIIQGFQEYETNMNSIQTILANTKDDGKVLSDVTAALDQLNEYSDQTIYNFSEMARNIGTFTAAGVSLDDSVNAIKGIANLAAISGSNSQQASTAMYQLSQALAAGKVNLMDWNSVVNAGMGGEVFKKALFETGKALGTITNVPLSATFDEWEAAGGTFREQMQSGWLTADVLKTSLGAFSGELDAATLQMLGFSEAAAMEMVALGELGIASATEVKTVTQLLGTVKEAIGSGWSQSFRLLIGDFEEAKGLFTYINGVIGGIVGESADSRNQMLSDWVEMGGRTTVLVGIKDAFEGLNTILIPIRSAFRDIFPPATADTLMRMSKAFGDFAKRIAISGDTALKIKRTFRGVFAALEIGIEIIKGIGSIFVDVMKQFSGSGDGILDVGMKFGDFFSRLNTSLVAGGGIKDFFDDVSDKVIGFIDSVKLTLEPLDKFKASVAEVVDYFKGGLFGEFKNEGEGILLLANQIGWQLGVLSNYLFGVGDPSTETLGDQVKTLTGRFERLKPIADGVTNTFSWLVDIFSKAAAPVGRFVEAVKTELGNIWDKIAESMSSGDFDGILDLVNTGLLGGLVALIAKFVNGGLNIDFGGGVFESINEALGTLTGTLEAMQLKLKAEALQKIAIAIGILTASMLVLSLIDSAALTKALTAMAVGFGQLMGAMAILGQISGGVTGNAGIAALSAAMIGMATAIFILSISVRMLSGLSWEELAKGIAGVTVMLGVLTAAVALMSKSSGPMIRISLGLIGIGIALNILVLAVKAMAEMSWEDMARGMSGVAGGLAIIAAAMHLMPDDMFTKATGVFIIAVALNVLALAVKSFAEMSYADMARGLVGVAGSLVAIALATQLMPDNMVLIGAGLLLISGALLVMAAAIRLISGLSWEELGKGIATIAGALLILALASNAMNGALLGAIAIAVISGSLLLLAEAMKEIGKLKLKEIGKALLAIAGVFAIIGIAGLVLAKLTPILLALGVALLFIGGAFALFGLGALLVAKAIQVLAAVGGAAVEILLAVLDGVITRIPTMATALAQGLISFVTAIADQTPALISALVTLLEALLQAVIDIAPKLVDTLIVLIDEALRVINEKAPDIINAGLNLLLNLLKGIADNIGEITTAVGDIIIGFTKALTDKIPDIVTAGAELLAEFLRGIAENLGTVISAAADVIVKFLEGITDNLADIFTAGGGMIAEFIEGIGSVFLDVVAAGKNVIIDLIYGIGQAAEDIVAAGVDTLMSFMDAMAKETVYIVNTAFKIIIDFVNALADAVDDNAPALRKAGGRLAFEIADGLSFGLLGVGVSAGKAAGGLAQSVIGGFKKIIESNSPSKVFMAIGGDIGQGLIIGIEQAIRPVEKSAESLGVGTIQGISRTLSDLPNAVGIIDEFNPTIRPVLDLTEVKREARGISSLIDAGAVSPSVSAAQASLIAKATQNSAQIDDLERQPVVQEIKFEQNNYSPTALSTNDIFRNTRSQIALAKKELEIV